MCTYNESFFDSSLHANTTYSCDDELVLPWYLDIAQLRRSALPGAVHANVIVMVPYKIAIDEAGDGDGAKLDEPKEEEQVETCYLPVSVRSRASHGSWSLMFLKRKTGHVLVVGLK